MVPGRQYLGAYVVPSEERDAWVLQQVKKWAEGVRELAKVSKRHPKTAYAGLGMLLQLEC